MTRRPAPQTTDCGQNIDRDLNAAINLAARAKPNQEYPGDRTRSTQKTTPHPQVTRQ